MASVRSKDIKSIHTIPKAQDIMFEECQQCNVPGEGGSQQQHGVDGFQVQASRILPPIRRHMTGFISPNVPTIPPALYLNHNFPPKRYPGFMTNNPANSLPTINLGLGKWRSSPPKEDSGCMMVQPNGLVSLFAHCNIRVDMTVDGAIRAYSTKMGISLAVNAEGNKAGMVHPMGCVYQRDDRVYVTTWDSKFSNRYAKIWKSGINFTNDMSYLTFLTDSAGTRTTTDKFCDLLYDFTKPILMDNARRGREYVESGIRIVDSAQYEVLDNGDRKWIANNIRVITSAQHVVKIARDKNSIQLKIGADGKTSMSTPHVYCTASNGDSKHLFVRKDEKRVHFDGKKFVVRNGSHSAGFNCSNKLSVF